MSNFSFVSRPYIPPSRIDLASLPPLLSTGDAGSFAEFTLKERDPKILQDLEAAPYFSPDLTRAFRKFRAEILGGVIQPLREDAPDADFWRTISKPYIGLSWLNVPWYWAETFFYRRILEIVGYFQLGAWHERDPFAPNKDAELKAGAAPERVRALLKMLGARSEPSDAETFEFMLYAALWGNRVDLSYNVEQQFGRAVHLQDERRNLLMDDAPRVWEFLAARSVRQVLYVTDNAGAELALDLAFIDHLLESRLVERITLHLKPQPFYVSDAMPQDVEKTLAAFATANDETRAIAKRLRAQLNAKRLELRVHWFYPTSLHFFEMPDDLFEMFRAADFIILKGDVNYRRAVGDAHWKPTIAFDYATRYFPKPMVTLRTLKSEVIVGLPADRVQALDHEDPGWRINGKRGVVQANLK